MKILLLVATLTITFSYCRNPKKDNFEFGPSYNTVRQKFGSPLIKNNMTTENCCGTQTLYKTSEIPTNDNAYHASKTIRAFSNGKVTEEKDIYRKNIDDTTLIQVNILSHWIWEENQIYFSGSIRKIDKRALNLSPKDFLAEHSKFPDYPWTKLSLNEIDSSLKVWGLTRNDHY
jgi:hypothetical protein